MASSDSSLSGTVRLQSRPTQSSHPPLGHRGTAPSRQLGDDSVVEPCLVAMHIEQDGMPLEELDDGVNHLGTAPERLQAQARPACRLT